MSAAPLELPAFIQVRLGDTGAFSRLKSEVADVTGKLTADFANSARTVEKSFDAITGANRQMLNSLGIGDLGRSLDIQRARTAAAEQYAAAASRAAAADAGQSRELQQLALAAEALAVREREAATAATVHAEAMGRVNAELAREATGTDATTTARPATITAIPHPARRHHYHRRNALRCSAGKSTIRTAPRREQLAPYRSGTVSLVIPLGWTAMAMA